jgi:hypothetical protein
MEGIETYKALFLANCDVPFKLHPDQYNTFIQSLEFNTEDSAIGHGIVNRAPEFGNIAKLVAEQNQMPYLENLMWSNDGNLFGYCFKNKAKLKQLFEIMNDIVYKALVEKDPNYFYLGPHGVWGSNNEPIQAIAYSLLNITSYPGHDSLYSAFAINTYPEDRFWNWPHVFQTSQISKQDFINLNYDNLKQFYADRNQPWPYN